MAEEAKTAAAEPTTEKIDTMKSFDFAVKSITEAGVNQLNLISNTIQSAVPAITNAAQGITDAVSASVKSVSEAAGSITGALGGLGGAVVNLAGAVANSAVSVAQSGVDTVSKAISKPASTEPKAVASPKPTYSIPANPAGSNQTAAKS